MILKLDYFVGVLPLFENDENTEFQFLYVSLLYDFYKCEKIIC